MLVTIMTPSTALAASGDPGTEYVVRAYARVEGKTFYSGYAYFTTLSAPIVVTGAADPVTWYSAVIHGLIHQGAPEAAMIDSHGFKYRRAGASAWTTVSLTDDFGFVSSSLTSLSPNTSYEYFAFAIAENEAFEGSTLTFTTPRLADPITNWTDTSVRYTIYASAGTGGAITPFGITQLPAGGSQIYMILPESGWRVDSVSVDGVNVGAVDSYVFTDVRANHTIYVSFKAAQTTVVVPPATPGGSTPMIPPTGMGVSSLILGLGLLVSGGLLLPHKKRDR